MRLALGCLGITLPPSGGRAHFMPPVRAARAQTGGFIVGGSTIADDIFGLFLRLLRLNADGAVISRLRACLCKTYMCMF